MPVPIPPEGHPRRGAILGIMCGCLVMVVAAVSSLNVAIPTIVRELDPSSTEQLWIVDAYALVFAGLLLLFGSLGDRYGRKKALILGLFLFGAASMAAAWAQDPAQLIAFRALMGVGSAMVMPATLSTLTAVYPPQERAKAIAAWAGFAGAGGAIGPLASGLLLERFWWGSVFFIAVPIAVVLVVLIVAVVPDSADAEKHPIDFVGSFLSVVALVAVVFAIIEGPEIGWFDPITVGSFVLGVVFGVVFVRWELSLDHPLLDPRLFKIPRFALGSLTITMAFLAMFGMFFLITLYLQFVLGYSPLGSAVRLLPFPLILIAIAPRNPILTAKFGTRKVVVAGFILQAVGFGLASFFDTTSPYWFLLLAVAPMAAGMAFLMPPMTNAIMNSLPQNKAGVASAVNDTTREVGGAVGIALLGSLLTTGYQSSLGDAADGLPEPLAEAARDSIGGALLAASEIGDSAGPMVVAAKQAFVDSVALPFRFAALLGLFMAVLIWLKYPEDSTAHVESASVS